MNWTMAAVVALTSLAGAAPGTAQPTPEPPPTASTVYARRTILDFSELKVTGHVEGPEGSFVHTRRLSRFQCLVKVRGDFLPEILSSVDRL